jgi:serine/threonine protein kinase
MAAVTHPNLATLHGLELWSRTALLVMEFCDGGTLADRLKRGALPTRDALQVGITIADAVGVLHESGVLHRDIKPSNIGFTASGTPKLLDFGLAKLVERFVPLPTLGDQTTYTEAFSTDGAGAIRGTPAYLSPDVLGGATPSAQDDLWSLGVTLLETCTGVNPYRDTSPAATIAHVLLDRHRISTATAELPPPLRELFRDLLHHQRELRPATAPQFSERVRLTLKGV